MNFDEENKIEINESKLLKIKSRVFILERDNYVAKKMKDNQMVDHIISIIDNEVRNEN